MKLTSRRQTLSQLLMRSNAIIALVAMLVFTILISLFVHKGVHDQTDALLLQLVRTEADSALEPHGLHVHDTAVTLPSLEGDTAEKFALIYDESCQIRVRTNNFNPFSIPPEWCQNTAMQTPGATTIIDIEYPGLPDLRAAKLSTQTRSGETVTFVVGIDHTAIDTSTWQTLRLALLLAIFVIAALTIAGAILAAGLTRDLTRLSTTCHTIGRGREDLRHLTSETTFFVSKKAPEELKTLTETLNALVQRLQKTLRAQDRFIAEAAHELRTPLTALMGDLELSLRRERPAEELRIAIERALGDAHRLHHIAESLLDTVRAESTTVQPVPTNILNLLQESIARFQPQLDTANITLTLNNTTQSPTALANPLATSRVFDNLIQNTLQHADANELNVQITQKPDTLLVEIHDNGRGIDPEILPELFTPFVHSTEGSGHGLGLGLHIARLMMHKQNGDLQHIPSTTQPPSGTTWHLHFTRTQPISST